MHKALVFAGCGSILVGAALLAGPFLKCGPLPAGPAAAATPTGAPTTVPGRPPRIEATPAPANPVVPPPPDRIPVHVKPPVPANPNTFTTIPTAERPPVVATPVGIPGRAGATTTEAGSVTTAPLPPPTTSQTVGIPGSAMVAPGGSVLFFRPPCDGPPPPPQACTAPPGSLVVRYLAGPFGAAGVRLTYDARVLMIEAPANATVQVRPPDGQLCTTVDDQPNVVRCSVTPNPARQPLVFTTSIAGRSEAVQLFTGCNNVTLTWAAGSAVSEVAAAVTPATALAAIWRFDNATQTFRAFSPQFPDVSDLLTVNGLDAVFICMRAPGTLTRPAI